MCTEETADAASFGYGRGVLNTVSSLYGLFNDKTEFTQKWINNVNYWVNSRNIVNEVDKACKNPDKARKINQFLR
ncbi:hypothetical protein [Clostridium beijerinckii]|uniref:hypothetical protein n=1 Tax=Clostridium beijerinckii TaxID=1520 RepID=UPI001570A9A3|nr:hypothetical protein [Clostridium beijerinckii]NRT73805.1 hypothetical protein [Clostridium beijerinckii]